MSPQALGGVDIENSFLGYAFVVDQYANIHWRAVGLAKDYELDSLFKVINELKAQHTKQQEKIQTNQSNQENSNSSTIEPISNKSNDAQTP